MTIKDAPHYLKVTDHTIHRLASAKQMPAFKIGGNWRFSRQGIDSWIQRQTATTLAEKPGK